MSAESSVAQRVLANADLHRALTASVGQAETTVPWYAGLWVFGAAAGLAWTGPLVLAGAATDVHDPRDANDPTEQ